MPVLRILNQIFTFVFPIALITTLMLNVKDKDLTKRIDKETNESKTMERRALEKRINLFLLISVLLLFILFIVILWTVFLKYLWIVFVFSIPLYLRYLAGASIAIGTLGNIIRSTEKSTMSARERLSIQTIAYVAWFLSMLKPYEKLWGIINRYPNPIITDALTALLFVGFSFIYCFLILSLAATPICYVIKLIDTMGNHIPMKKKLEQIGEYFVSGIDIEINNKTLLLCMVNYIKNSKQLAKYLLAVLFPIAYLLDLIKLLVIALFYELRSAIGYIVTFFRAVKRAIVALVSWGLKLSDKHIVAVSFRLALIFALVSIVVLNRYQPVFKEYEESTAVFEFLASSIIIPIVFEWIYSIRNTSGTQEG